NCWTANWFVTESDCRESPCLNAGLRQTKAGSISASNRERAEPQINESNEDNAEQEEDEKTDESALNQNKEYRFNVNSQSTVKENLEKEDSGPAPVGVQEKPKQGKGS
ncbi:MAG: hypothetical protein EZS28_044686, partial [Streblomastix strix]